MSARVLVVSHEARRTGAPRVAIELLRSLRDGDTEVVCVLRAGGPLAGELAEQADRLYREPLPRVRALARRVRRLRRLVDRLDERVARRMLLRHRPSVVYLNTVKSVCYVKPALELSVPTVLHVHELEPLLSSTLGRYPIGRGWDGVRLVACSTAARDNLARVVGVQPDHVDVVPSPVDGDALGASATRVAPGSTTAPGVPFTIGACGTVDRRKGVDLWLEMAKRVHAVTPDAIRFRWVGREAGGWARDLARHLGLEGVVEFVGEVEDATPLIAEMDVFTLPSREDPFPLVVLEAMALSRPVVAFDVGGVREQLGDTGVLVAADRPDAMAGAVLELMDDPAERGRLGTRAAARVRSRFGVEPFRAAVRRIVAAELGRSPTSR